MKKIYFFLFLCITINAQKKDNSIIVNDNSVNYYKIGNIKKNKFYVIVTNDNNFSISSEKIKCLKSLSFYLKIPENYLSSKEELVLNFITEILSKNKLLDKDLFVIADDDYFNLYQEMSKKVNELNAMEYKIDRKIVMLKKSNAKSIDVENLNKKKDSIKIEKLKTKYSGVFFNSIKGKKIINSNKELCDR